MKEFSKCVSKHSTLCWDCEKACGKCSWSREFVPVKGWKAIPTKLFQYTTGKGRKRIAYYTGSFDVYECPEFEPLKMQSEEEFLRLFYQNEPDTDQEVVQDDG
jgi:hypothetical protein